MPSASIPAAAAMASAVAGLAGTGISVLGGLASSNAQAQSANYQAEVAKNNATIAGYNAAQATEAGQSQVAAQGLKDRAQMGALVAGQAALGTDVNSGSNVDVQKSVREAGLYDEATIQHNALMQAYGYQTAAAGYNAQAGLDTATAANATALAPLTAAGGLLSGAAGVGSKWATFVQQGVGSGTSAAGSSFGNIASDASNPLTYG